MHGFTEDHGEGVLRCMNPVMSMSDRQAIIYKDKRAEAKHNDIFYTMHLI